MKGRGSSGHKRLLTAPLHDQWCYRDGRLGGPVRGIKLLGVAGVTLWILTSMGIAGPAAAQVSGGRRQSPVAGGVERRPAVASFEGGSINLAQDWGDARACLVWRQGGVLECFRTPEALDAREADLGSTLGVSDFSDKSSSFSCGSPLRLYDYTYYGGRQLSFWDRGYWQNLWDYGFDDRTSSYIVGGCYTYLAEYADGGGWWYPGPTYPWAGEPVMYWNWQNTISSLFIT